MVILDYLSLVFLLALIITGVINMFYFILSLSIQFQQKCLYRLVVQRCTYQRLRYVCRNVLALISFTITVMHLVRI